MRQLRIAIIGAGIAGLTAARALQLQGFSVRIYEQSTRLGDVGAGLTVSPNATHVLNAIGLAAVLQRIGMRPERGGVKHWRTGETMVDIMRGDEMLERYGAAYFQVHRADLHEALAATVHGADPQAIVLGHRVHALHGLNDAVAAGAVEMEFANGARIAADVVIGADGLRSRVRELLFGAEQPRYTGYIAFRGLVPMARLPQAIVQPTSCISIGPGRTFTRYLVRGGEVLNYVALSERDDWREEGWSIPCGIDEVLEDFSGWYEDLRRIVRATPDNSCFKWALFDREPLPQWSRGCVTLIGDAAHPMLPFLGQGAAMAMEDAMVLARAFGSGGSLQGALRRYVEARHERTTWVMLKSRATALSYHRADPDNYASRTHLSAESLGIMGYNPVTVPV